MNRGMVEGGRDEWRVGGGIKASQQDSVQVQSAHCLPMDSHWTTTDMCSPPNKC